MACARTMRQWERVWHHALPIPTITAARAVGAAPCGAGVTGASAKSTSDGGGTQAQEDDRLWSIVTEHMDSPLLLKGAVQHWPCVDPSHPRTWQDCQRWRSMVDRPVVLEAGAYTRQGFVHKHTGLRDFVDYLIASEQTDAEATSTPVFEGHAPSPDEQAPLYLAQQDIQAVLPEMCGDFALPLKLEERYLTQRLVWLGPSNVVSPLHRDPTPNLFCQVRGLKRFVLVDASRRDPRLLPSTNPRRRNTSRLDLTRSLLELEEESPGFCELPRFSAVLGPGDVLFIPRDMWHFVEGVETDFVASLSFMFDLPRHLKAE